MINPKRIEEIKGRIVALDDNGNWEAVHTNDINHSCVEADSYVVGIEMAPEDAEFIANARQDIPDLVEAVESLQVAFDLKEKLHDKTNRDYVSSRNEVKRLREALKDIHSQLCSIRGLNGTHDIEITSICTQIAQTLEGLSE